MDAVEVWVQGQLSDPQPQDVELDVYRTEVLSASVVVVAAAAAAVAVDNASRYWTVVVVEIGNAPMTAA